MCALDILAESQLAICTRIYLCSQFCPIDSHVCFMFSLPCFSYLVLIIMPLQFSLKSGIVMPPALLSLVVCISKRIVTLYFLSFQKSFHFIVYLEPIHIQE